MYTYEQIQRLKADLDNLSELKAKLRAINAPDMSLRISIHSKNCYDFDVICTDKAIIDILRNNYELQIQQLENKINSVTLINANAF